MIVRSLDNNNFKGQLIRVNKFSDKPNKCVNKIANKLEQIIKPKDYNLYLQQDYSKNKMKIIADYPFPLKPEQRASLFTREEISIPITSNASKYVEASKNVIEKFEYNQYQKEQQAWEQKQKRKKMEDIKDTLELILLSPVYIAEKIIRSINPKWANNFENLLQKIGI